MSIESGRSACLDEEVLAAFADGRLKRSEMPAVLEHLRDCPRCMSALEVANEVLAGKEQRPFRWWWAGAAAAVIGGMLIAVPLLRRDESPVQRLVQLAPASQRNVEARLSGGFAWAPYRGPDRAADDPANVQRFKLVGETASILERAEATSSAEAQHAAGLALLLIDRVDESIARLRDAAEKSPRDAKAWSDLAAAEYAAALRHGRASLYPEALAHADRALRVDPRFAEALFNRALILQRIGLTEEARAAWQRYLEVDGTSKWADEARQHLEQLPLKTSASLFKDEEARLRTADQPTIDAIAARFPQQARTFAEAELLGRWGENGSEADLAIARKIGDALARLSGESLLRDAVAAIDRAAPPQRQTLAAAHALYRQARITYARQRPAEAEPGLRRAAQLFGSSPMALVARYYAANTRVDQNDLRGGHAELQALRAEVPPQHAALLAQIDWEMALCAVLEAEWESVVERTTRAADGFRRLGEKSNLAFVQGMHAEALLYLGRPDEGWRQWIESFALQSGEGLLDRLQVAVGESALVDQATGRTDSARAVLALAESVARSSGNDVLLSYALLREALMASQAGDAEEASRASRESMRVAMRISDSALRARAVADAQLAAGAVAAESDPRLAIQLLSQAIRHYEETGKDQLLPEAKLLRSRAAAGAGDRDAASRDVEGALAQVEARRARISGHVTGTGVYDAATELYGDAIRLALARGDAAGAFAYAERSRGTIAAGEAWRPIDAPELQRRLRGSGAAVLEIVSLGRESVAFFVSESELAVARDGDPSRGLYERVIRPFEARLARARQLIVVADPLPDGQSFAALYDPVGKRHLIEQLPVAMALSASSLEPESRRPAARSVVAVALPSGHGMAALPESDGELRDLESLYPKAKLIAGGEATVQVLLREAPRASVVHIAGHTQRDEGSGDGALLFAKSERVSWSTAASMAIGDPIVVLAACETLRVPQTPRARSLSVGGGFLAAGATAVVGTLAPVADNDARPLFRTVHQELAKGAPPVLAVQRAQIEALQRRSPAWRAVTLLVTRVSPL